MKHKCMGCGREVDETDIIIKRHRTEYGGPVNSYGYCPHCGGGQWDEPGTVLMP